jgi:hypothetical protein
VTAKVEQLLAEDMGQYSRDPLGWVWYAFPWGHGPLEGIPGPEQWGLELFDELGRHLRGPDWDQPFQKAIASGHGITKSATIAQLALWSLCTMEDARAIVTANTELQVRTKTWPEITKWYHRLINKHWFTLTDTSIYRADRDHEKNWRLDRVTWSANNTEAFAGLHNQGKRISVFFDESSNIHDKVWEVTEGALTDMETQIVWCAFGNGTRNVGRFFECFGKYRHRWRARQIDSRNVRVTNKDDIRRKIEDHGEDSDYVKVRVRGMFPSRGTNQMIAQDTVDQAQRREAVSSIADPLIIGVDVAREGDDQSVIGVRRGQDARTWPWKKLRGADSTQVASHVSRIVKGFQAQGLTVDAIFVDATGGYGGAVIDRLRELGYAPIGVQFGGAAAEKQYANKRAEIWFRMADWLKVGGAIPADDELSMELTSQTYFFNVRDQLILTDKASMKLDGLPSPDCGDALAVTFAEPVLSEGMKRVLSQEELEEAKARKRGERGRGPEWDYNPLDHA